MKKIFFAVMLLMSLFVRVGFAEDKELRIFTWSEYMDERRFAADFKAATGIKVKIDIYENNEEMIAKLLAGGIKQYDIIIPSDFVLPILISQNLIQPLDHTKLPNLKNLSDRFRNIPYDPGNKYTVGWQWGTVGLMYNKNMVKPEAVKSWSVMFDEKKQPGPFYFMDSARDTMSIALLYLGYDANSTNLAELKKAAELLTTAKKTKNCQGFKPGVGGKNDVVAGRAAMAVVYNGDAERDIAKDPKKLGFAIPKEGSTLFLDLMAIPAKAPHPDAAHKWINWILEAKRGAMLSNYNRYATPNQASMPYIIPADLKNDEIYPSADTLKRLHSTKDLGSASRVLDEAWTRVKAQ
jgi:spermidine/putrescine transport system substrate-binding protein